MRRQTRRSGFTFLEILVAISMMATVCVALYGSLQVAFKGRDHAVGALQPVRAQVLTMGLLGEDIQAALPPTGIMAGGFIGQDARTEGGKDADTLAFCCCSNMPDGIRLGGDVRQVEFAFVQQPNETEGILVRRVTNNLLSPEAVTPTEETLCRHVLSLNLRYYDGAAWQDNWNSTTQANALPAAVEVTLEVTPPPAVETAEVGYRLTRIFVLPCGRATAMATQ